MIINIIGWFGTSLLMLAGVPQLIKTIREGHAQGLSWYYLILVWAGMMHMILYVFLTNKSLQLICSYLFQMTIFGLLIYRKKFPRKSAPFHSRSFHSND